MEMQITEEKARQFWQDPAFQEIFSGCKHINAILSAKGKHIFLTPDSINFEKWGIALDSQYAESLAVVVDIVRSE